MCMIAATGFHIGTGDIEVLTDKLLHIRNAMTDCRPVKH